MEKTIQSAEERLSGEKLQQFYSHILKLYEQKSWAQEQIERIQRQRDQEEEEESL